MQPAVARNHIAAMRRFNRFYTQRIGVLEEGLTGSDYSLAEARLLYELAHRKGVTAVALGGDLGLDQGYLSRILARFAKSGLVVRSRSAADGRERPLALTARGRKEFARLNRAAERQIGGLLGSLAPRERLALTGAMERIERLLGGTPGKADRFTLRAPRPGDLGWIVHRHGALYASEYGWDASFETLVVGIVAAFAKDNDSAYERCWVADIDGAVVGSVFLVRESDSVAKLRLLYVEPEARGLGIGARLVAECVAFARSAGYRTLTLWTNDILVSARRLYEAAEFRLIREAPHHSFGKDLVEQTWSLEL
jgi:DNA-binding MarR family transcriptional regulator/GNAT superfamily N-acetyltransferase